MSEPTYPIVHAARILQIMPAPGPLADCHGNEYVGYALVGLSLEWQDGTHEVRRDILPFGTDGGIIGAPRDAFYLLHALGDHRPEFAVAA